jgi:hypothetical protein
MHFSIISFFSDVFAIHSSQVMDSFSVDLIAVVIMTIAATILDSKVYHHISCSNLDVQSMY